MQPSISLIICTYNNVFLLEKVLEALSKQIIYNDLKWSVLVVDNNCTDDTPKIVKKFIQSASIPDLSIVNEEKQGLSYARLCGIQNTSSDWIAFVDDDCLLQEDWVEKAVIFAESHPKCGAFGGKVILNWEVSPSEVLKKYEGSFAAQNLGEESKQINNKGFIVGTGLVINRTAILQSSWLNKQFLTDRVGKDLTSGGDGEIIIRIRQTGYEIWYNPECVLKHYIPSKRISESYLIRLHYGFGLMTPQLGLLSATNHPFSHFVFIYLLKLLKRILQLVLIIMSVLVGKSHWIEVLMMLNRFRGELKGVLHILLISTYPNESNSNVTTPDADA